MVSICALGIMAFTVPPFQMYHPEARMPEGVNGSPIVNTALSQSLANAVHFGQEKQMPVARLPRESSRRMDARSDAPFP